MSPDFIIIEKSGPISGPDRVETFWSGPELGLDLKNVKKLPTVQKSSQFIKNPINDRLS